MSIVPLIMNDACELIYEKEIVPNISSHAIRTIKKGIKNTELAKKTLNILSYYSFDVGSNTSLILSIIYS